MNALLQRLVPPLFALVLLSSMNSTGAQAQTPEVPASPPTHLVWESHPVLTTSTRRALESILLQHQHLTGERLFLVLAPRSFVPPQELSGPDAPRLARQFFDRWSLDTTTRGANALLLLRETGSGSALLGLHQGSGISLPDGALPAEALEETLRELLDQGTLQAPDSWDRLAVHLLKAWLETSDSPTASQFPKFDFPPLAKTQTASPTSPWVWLGLLLAVSSTLFYWTYDQILGQDVLIGVDRWILFGPRLKLLLWLGRLPDGLTRECLETPPGEPQVYWRKAHG